jgi:hypothetical protein
VVEQQVPVGDHALQDADGADDRGDGDPGNLALEAAGLVVAVLVGGGLELAAADQVPSGLPVRAGCRVGAASGAQAEDLPGPHAGQESADYERSRAEVPHQDRGLVEVERCPPWLPGDPAGHGDAQRAWPGALRGCGRQPFPVVEPVGLAA